ncbi:MAG TPA: kelch repeat-containing protein, partial [Planctomycetota bacterium]|nr:kelch repeat-containing protein [Planctomycetota bacterium]
IGLLEKEFAGAKGDDLARATSFLEETRAILPELRGVNEFYTPGDVKKAASLLLHCEKMADLAASEPPPRALSPIAYDAKTKMFVIFGGDHLDYLTNDTWVFDPARSTWLKRHPPTAPPPRANHVLKADGDGTVVLTGGYTYTSSTDYVGGQYRDHGDGEWIYDIAADRWTGKRGVGETRVYRSGRLHPDFYLQGPLPDAKGFAGWLAAVPANTWTLTKPPQLPALNRDWGTAVLDPDRDLILRWSGGHSAHGGTDVLQYHLNTNRWELTAPVEFPLGQLYTNTEYPEGWNFNHRPWITGHTYQNYGYDPVLKKMLFTGKRQHCYVYDPDLGDWTARFAKPKGMVYGDCFYTLTLTPTPQGLVCWTQEGKLFRFQAAGSEWVEMPLRGAKMPGSVVDNSTIVYDSKRDRLLAVRKGYGEKNEFDGTIAVVEVKSGKVTLLSPAGKEKADAVPYLCQLRYDPASDLLLGGCTLEPDAQGVRRTPAYDCAGDRWVSLKLGGDDPSGKKGRNVSLGMMVDPKRKLFWAVDTNSNVFVLRLDAATADLKPL